MRSENYKRMLTNEGYMVMGSGRNWNSYDPARCAPIKMSLTNSGQSDEPIYDNLEELIQLADSDMFHPILPRIQECSKADEDFCMHYAEIIRGDRLDWQLHAFCVFVGGIQLYYGNRKANDYGYLWINKPERLKLTFRTARTLLGFDPIYKVTINHRNDGSFWTYVEEDLGYIRREISFHLVNPTIQNAMRDYDNQYINVIEYVGI